jgi:hypothetical protein
MGPFGVRTAVETPLLWIGTGSRSMVMSFAVANR